jgi:hypothetical protein
MKNYGPCLKMFSFFNVGIATTVLCINIIETNMNVPLKQMESVFVRTLLQKINSLPLMYGNTAQSSVLFLYSR